MLRRQHPLLRHAHYDAHGNIVLLQGEHDDAIPTPDHRVVEEVVQDPKQLQSSSASEISTTPSTTHGFFDIVQRGLESDVCFGAIEDERREVQDTQELNETENQSVHRSAGRMNVVRSLVKPLRRCGTMYRRTVRTLSRHPDRRVRIGYEVARFSTTFASAFTVLFIALNFSSYTQMLSASLMPEAVEQQRAALTAMTRSDLHGALLAVPSLPEAGALSDARIKLDIAPPDDRLIIPALGKNVPIVSAPDDALRRGDWKMFEKDIQDALRYGIVHYPGTAVPGQIGNVFFTGHSSYQFWDSGKFKDVFALLPQLEVGDTYAVYFRGNVYHYRITGKKEVLPSDVSVLDQPHDRLSSTLMTCTPVGTNLRRLILSADQYDPASGELLRVDEPFTVQEQFDWGGELTS